MNKTKNRTIVAAILISAIMLMAAVMCVGARIPAAHAEEAPTTVTYNFTDQTELNDFTPVYSAEETDGSATMEEFSEHWTLDTAAGKVSSKRDPAGDGGANGWERIAQLVLTKYRFTNFEAELTLNYASGATWGWAGLQFRKSSLLSAGRKGGCFAFTEQEGHANIWGDSVFFWDDNGTDRENKSAKNPDEEAFKSTHKYSPFLLTVRVVGKSCDFTVSSTDKSTVYATVHTDFKKDEAVRKGFVSLTSSDDYHDFHSLKITNLDSSGNPTALEESDVPQSIELDKTVTEYKVGKSFAIGCNVQPAAAASNVVWSVSDGSVAVVRNGSITGISEGTVTVTASSALNTDIKDSVTLTFTAPDKSSNRYTFADESVMNNFTAAYVVDQNNDGNTENYTEHWKIEDGLLKRINFPESNNDSSENFACLYLNDCEAVNFETTLVYRSASSDYGWIGITSGTLLYNKRCMDEGLGMFIQREGQPTVWGKNTDGHDETTFAGYTASDWHILKVRAYGNRVEMYLDDLTEPAFTKTVALENGHVGILTTCKAAYEIKSFEFAYLDANGNKEDYSGIEKLEITNKITTATVGDSLTLNIAVTPDAQIDYVFTTSDSNIAFVNGGVLRFISDGEVTITVICNHEKRLTDSMTITVSPKQSPNNPSDPGGNTNNNNTNNNNTTEPKKAGCKSSAAAEGTIAAIALLTISAVAIGKKRKSRV